MFTVADISLCLGIRLHQDNPWVLSNLELQLTHYCPRPAVIVVDQGSEPKFAEKIKRVVTESGGVYLRDDYQGLYSPSRAHNQAASAVKTELIFFADPDFFMVADFFHKLVGMLNNTALGSKIDLMINLPAVHLNEAATARFRAAESSRARSAWLDRVWMTALFDSTLESEFVAPYSNVFLCHRLGFSYSGGYDESFVAHGSEDFEFLIRFALIMGQYPPPPHIIDDLYRPQADDFFHQNEYKGFRSLLAAMSYPAEAHGLVAFHLHHPLLEHTRWKREGDSSRDRFQSRVRPYLDRPLELLSRDWLPRGKRLLIWNTPPSPVPLSLWLAFRLAGYHLTLPLGDDFSLAKLSENFDALAVFRPAATDDQSTAPWRAEVDRRRLPLVTITPGASPEIWICASEASPAALDPGDHKSQESLVTDGQLQQFQLDGQLYLEPYQRSSEYRLKPKAYLLGRLGLMSDRQWEAFANGHPWPGPTLELRWPKLAAMSIKLENLIIQGLMWRQGAQLGRYKRNRDLFFRRSEKFLLAAYYCLWRGLFEKSAEKRDTIK